MAMLQTVNLKDVGSTPTFGAKQNTSTVCLLETIGNYWLSFVSWSLSPNGGTADCKSVAYGMVGSIPTGSTIHPES